MTTDLSFRIDYQLDEEIKWAKEELRLGNKSDVARKLLRFGVDYLKKAKEMVENPLVTEEEKEEYRLQLEEFKKEKSVPEILDKFSDEELEFITFRSWKAMHQRKSDRVSKEKELSRMDREMQEKDPDHHKLKQKESDAFWNGLDL